VAHLLATLGLAGGGWLAARHYPDGFDWVYMVMSALASQKHNPEGALWFAGAFVAAMVLLWPVTRWLKRALPPSGAASFGVGALQVGLVLGVLTGLERALFPHLSDVIPKGHESLALASFAAMYVGMWTLGIGGLRRDWYARWQLVTLIALLFAIGAVQLWLWLGQRELGWVGRDWRAMGIPPWRSFAFWQWTAFGAMLCVFGYFAWMKPTLRRSAWIGSTRYVTLA
jgi:hypothetical protein